jgi:NTE family protein
MSIASGATGYALGVALSGGGFRGMAHIGVLRGLDRRGLKPDFISGTSAGSLVGALYASGKTTEEIETLASQIFWPKLLGTRGLADFCRDHLPRTFAELTIPFSVVVTALPSKQPEVFESGEPSPAIAASCAMPWLFRKVKIGSNQYTDGGWGCVLPAVICRKRGCRKVISSDVWWRASVARKSGFKTSSRFAEQIYSRQYMEALRNSDLVIRPSIPASGIIPGRFGMRSLISCGELAAEQAMADYVCNLD